MLKRTFILTSISVLFFAFIFLHFSIVSINVSPQSWKSSTVHALSTKYMFPLFDQRWGVFAPVPREESRVFYKFFSNDSWSKEFSFHEEMEKKNHINAGRIADMTSFYLGEETRQYALKNNDQIDYSAVKTSYYYKRVLYTIYAHILQEQAQEKPDSIILILERDLFPKKGYSTKKTIRDYFKPDACE